MSPIGDMASLGGSDEDCTVLRGGVTAPREV
jgi:hypothetical protein